MSGGPPNNQGLSEQIQPNMNPQKPVESPGFLTNNLIDLDDKSIPGEISPDKESINGISVSDFKIK